MAINDLTIGEIKELAALFGGRVVGAKTVLIGDLYVEVK